MIGAVPPFWTTSAGFILKGGDTAPVCFLAWVVCYDLVVADEVVPLKPLIMLTALSNTFIYTAVH